MSQLRGNDYHRRLVEAVGPHILTTNYDYNIERALGSFGTPASPRRESRYSVFRRRKIRDHFVWYIHGEVDHPETILLGHDHYSGQLQKLRDYATADRNSTRTRRSLFKLDELEYEASGAPYSWIDVFFRDEIHIVGLALDYTEIDLWWLLAYKRRLRQMKDYIVGETIFHEIRLGEGEEPERAKVSILKSFGVEVVTHKVREHSEAYDRVIAMLDTP